MKELLTIQQKLNAPKTQFNKFGNYYYRSCEDILEALKPLLAETQCTLQIFDDIALVGDRYYVKATILLTNDKGETATSVSFAREQEKVTGQIEAQITGAASSYARKYALNALFCIDDNKDPDATNTHGKEAEKTPKTKPTTSVKAEGGNPLLDEAIKAVEGAKTKADLDALYTKYGQPLAYHKDFLAALNKKANGIGG